MNKKLNKKLNEKSYIDLYDEKKRLTETEAKAWLQQRMGGMGAGEANDFEGRMQRAALRIWASPSAQLRGVLRSFDHLVACEVYGITEYLALSSVVSDQEFNDAFFTVLATQAENEGNFADWLGLVCDPEPSAEYSGGAAPAANTAVRKDAADAPDSR